MNSNPLVADKNNNVLQREPHEVVALNELLVTNAAEDAAFKAWRSALLASLVAQHRIVCLQIAELEAQ